MTMFSTRARACNVVVRSSPRAHGTWPALCGAVLLAVAVGCPSPPLTPAQAAGCDRASPTLQDLAETTFFLQHFRAGTTPSLAHADSLDERAAIVEREVSADPGLGGVLARVVEACRTLAGRLRVYAPLAETESADTDRAEEDVMLAADALRAALDEAGLACRREYSAFPTP